MSRGSRASAYSTSCSGGHSGSNDSQYSAVQRHSSYSKSSRKNETVPIPSIYRSKSPGTVASLKKHYFVPGPGHEVFANWKSLGNCLRCFGKHHAKDCHVYRESCSEPCKQCVFLYHRSNQCKKYELNGAPKAKN